MLCEACSGADIGKVWQAQQKRRRQIGMIRQRPENGKIETPAKIVAGCYASSQLSARRGARVPSQWEASAFGRAKMGGVFGQGEFPHCRAIRIGVEVMHSVHDLSTVALAVPPGAL
jgi:hypothetical protein